MKKKNILLAIIFFIATGCLETKTKTADLVAFSYNRPLQLYALLESIETYITGLQEIHVIYRSTDESYATAYEEVKETFPYVIFWQQGENPHQDFKPLTLKASFESPSEYIMFAVDDIIVKDYIDIPYTIEMLEETEAYGFFFRLGLHLTRCYPWNKDQKIPAANQVTDNIYGWIFKTGEYDWGYPHTVDMTLYRKKDIEQDIKQISYSAPNPFEGHWHARSRKIMHKTGLCHKESKIVNLPLNIVNNNNNNRNMNAFTSQELLEKFNEGLKIDITPLFKITNKSAHMDYVPEFTSR